jgi:hypothetical protein
MAITWGRLRDQIRRSIIRDDQLTDEQNTWANAILADCMALALDQFCSHAAVATSVTYTSATGTEYALPSNRYQELPINGTVFIWDGETASNPTYLRPISAPHKAMFPQSGEYSEWPAGTLKLGEAPSDGNNLYVKYFAYYDYPIAVADVVNIPQWATMAIHYLVLSLLMTSEGLQSGMISQWKTRPEAGGPEENALREQHKWYYKLYIDQLARHPKQNQDPYHGPRN